MRPQLLPPMLHRLAIVSMLLLITGCATSVSDVTTEYDKNIDFAKYTTYSFATGTVIERPGYEAIDKARLDDRIRAAVQGEMAKRGLDNVTDGPQLIVTYTAGAQKKQDLVRVAPTYTGTNYDAPGAWRPAGWYSDVDDQFWSRQYTEGTLLLDIYDAKTKAPVWKSYCVVQIMDTDPQKNRAPEVVAKALKGFPPK